MNWITFFKGPKWTSLRGPTMLVRELKTSLSSRPSIWTCRCSHSRRSEFSCSRMPSFTFQKRLNLIFFFFFKLKKKKTARIFPSFSWVYLSAELFRFVQSFFQQTAVRVGLLRAVQYLNQSTVGLNWIQNSMDRFVKEMVLPSWSATGTWWSSAWVSTDTTSAAYLSFIKKIFKFKQI